MKRRCFLTRTAACAASGVFAPPMHAQSGDMLDLVVRGGTVIDPAAGVQARVDVGVRGGRIAALEPALRLAPGTRVVDAHGKLVTPGLIDLHSQAYPPPVGTSRLEPARDSNGVTTTVSAGRTGIHELAEFRRAAARERRYRVYSFVHLDNPALRDESESQRSALARTLAQSRDLVLGVAVHPAAAAEARNDEQALQRAISVLEQAQTRGRILCNIAGPRQSAVAVLERLRPGDIFAHAYSGAREDLLQSGTLHQAALDARRRGVIVDGGHGGRHFDLATARLALEQGFAPDVLTTAAPAPAPSLAQIMSRFLNLGFGLDQVLAMVTVNPARLIGRETKLGTLDLGAPADIAILELIEAPVEFIETDGTRWHGTRLVRAVGTLRAGMPLP